MRTIWLYTATVMISMSIGVTAHILWSNQPAVPPSMGLSCEELMAQVWSAPSCKGQADAYLGAMRGTGTGQYQGGQGQFPKFQ